LATSLQLLNAIISAFEIVFEINLAAAANALPAFVHGAGRIGSSAKKPFVFFARALAIDGAFLANASF
jgi:hypothetical protein